MGHGSVLPAQARSLRHRGVFRKGREAPVESGSIVRASSSKGNCVTLPHPPGQHPALSLFWQDYLVEIKRVHVGQGNAILYSELMK